jgi:arsenate reductase (thioredoxin)
MARDIEQFDLLNTRSQLRRAARHAFGYYQGAIPLDQCEAVVQESYDLLDRTAVIKRHLVALAEKWSIERLRRVGILDERLSRTVPEILFVDTDDTGLAAAAAALLTGYGRGRVHASSAGEKPAAELDPALARVAAELDIDITDAFPKSVTSEAVRVADVIVTLGAADLAVAGEEHQMRHWDLPALTDQPDDAIRAVLTDVDRRTLLLLADLLATPAGSTS